MRHSVEPIEKRKKDLVGRPNPKKFIIESSDDLCSTASIFPFSGMSRPSFQNKPMPPHFLGSSYTFKNGF
jgi:hypothetical protein